MAKDLIIGAVSNYDWDKIKYWINSIKKSGYSGDIAIVGTNLKRETLEKLAENNVDLLLYGKKNENGDYEAPNNGAPHVERFFYLWNYLKNTKEDYHFVITTDVRDVIFQRDPTEVLKNLIHPGINNNIVVSSEGMRYKDEPWNSRNINEAFGPFFHAHMKDELIYNVGVIAGLAPYVKDMMLMIFQMSINRPIPIVDQAVFNFLIQHEPYKETTAFTDNNHAWAAQLGTTYEAVKSGSGDIGLNFGSDPSKLMIYQMQYVDEQPKLNDEGLVVNDSYEPFAIVHQYDRTKDWYDKIVARYQ
jgi:hypothetical protein